MWGALCFALCTHFLRSMIYCLWLHALHFIMLLQLTFPSQHNTLDYCHEESLHWTQSFLPSKTKPMIWSGCPVAPRCSKGHTSQPPWWWARSSKVRVSLHKRRTKSVLVLEPFQPPGAAAARCLDSAAAPWQGAVKHRASNEGPWYVDVSR